MNAARTLVSVVALLTVSACGSDGDSTSTTVPLASTSSSAASTTVAPTTTSPTTTVPPVTTSPATAPTTTAPTDGIVAVWPTSDLVISTPEEAAAGFVRAVFDVEPVLGAFQQGDSRSGEIEVLPPVEASGGTPRSVLFLRQLGPANGWFVIGAGSDVDSISNPSTGSTVPAGALTVEGLGTGFEATIVVRAFLAGDPTNELDRQVVMAGNFGETAPYVTTLDLSGAETGDVVVLLVSGGVGLETDTGDFSAVPIVIGAASAG